MTRQNVQHITAAQDQEQTRIVEEAKKYYHAKGLA